MKHYLSVGRNWSIVAYCRDKLNKNKILKIKRNLKHKIKTLHIIHLDFRVYRIIVAIDLQKLKKFNNNRVFFPELLKIKEILATVDMV
jgi:hypothetical protein